MTWVGTAFRPDRVLNSSLLPSKGRPVASRTALTRNMDCAKVRKREWPWVYVAPGQWIDGAYCRFVKKHFAREREVCRKQRGPAGALTRQQDAWRCVRSRTRWTGEKSW